MAESTESIDKKTNPLLKSKLVLLKPSLSCQGKIDADLKQEKPHEDKLTELAHFKELLGEPEEDAL